MLVDIAGEGMPAHMWSALAAPGQSILEFGRERATRDTGGFSWKNAVVAEVRGEVAASLVGYRLDDPYDLGALAEMPPIVQPLLKLEAKAPGSWYVNVLATFPEFRRLGIAAKLLEIAESKGREVDAPALSVIVGSWNETACAPLPPRRLCRSRHRVRDPVSRISPHRRLGLNGKVAHERHLTEKHGQT